MLFSKEYVGYLAREVTKKLIAGKFIETAAVPAMTERVNAALVDELSLEDRINDDGSNPFGPTIILNDLAPSAKFRCSFLPVISYLCSSFR